MAVLCSHCGEELMGAVNRCWRCGTPLQAHAGRPDIPPVRRSPITGPLDGPLEAVVLSEPGEQPAVEQGELLEKDMPLRRGSPFRMDARTIRVAGPVPAPTPTATATPTAAPQRSYQFQLASQVAAVATPVLAILALFLSFAVPIAALCLATLAIGFGTWGLYSERRGTAILGLVVASGVLAWAGFATVVQMYQWIYGINPFATSPPLTPPSDF
jgi:hypothetical protein